MQRRMFLKVGMDKELYLKAQYKAKDAELTLANFVRQLLKNSKVIPKKDDTKLLYHLSKIGNNINQIARKIHSESYREIDSLVVSLLTKIKNDLDILVLYKL